jgi:DNA-binding MarR family transcriptional regulator
METIRPSARLLSAIWSTTRALKRHVAPALHREHGVDFKDFMLLDGIERGGGAIHPGQLCDAMSMTPSAVSRMLDDATRAGLVVRELDPGDLRHIKVQITPKGRQILSAVRETMTAMVDPWLKALPRTQAEALISSIESLSESMSRTDAPAKGVRRRSTRAR